MISVVASAAHAVAPDCSVLEGKTYRCTQKSDLFGPVVEDEWTFSSNEDGKLNLRTLTQADFRCTCLAKGTYKKPKFDTSLGFLCGGNTGAAPDANGDAITGKVTGNAKTVTGQLLSVNDAEPDDARIYTCTPAAPLPYALVQTYSDHCVPYNYLTLDSDLSFPNFYGAYEYCAQKCSDDPSCVQIWVSYESGPPRSGPYWCMTGGGPGNQTWDGTEIQCNYPPIGTYGEWYSKQP